MFTVYLKTRKESIKVNATHVTNNSGMIEFRKIEGVPGSIHCEVIAWFNKDNVSRIYFDD